jgi:hypothetical protein
LLASRCVRFSQHETWPCQAVYLSVSIPFAAALIEASCAYNNIGRRPGQHGLRLAVPNQPMGFNGTSPSTSPKSLKLFRANRSGAVEGTHDASTCKTKIPAALTAVALLAVSPPHAGHHAPRGHVVSVEEFDRSLTRAVPGSPAADLRPDSSPEVKGIR